MSQFSASVILEGRAIPSPTPVRLHAGPLTMLLEPVSGFLRQIRRNDKPILNGVYVAVRDSHWGTVKPVIRDMRIEQGPESFLVRFSAECRTVEIHFVWNGTITGEVNGTIRYVFEGGARSDFLHNRIGFCVLHGTDCGGRPCRVEHADGRVTVGEFPRFISPHQPFRQIRAITHEVRIDEQPAGSVSDPASENGVTPANSLLVEVRMEGDVFEMEDQRNWTDASFKTYCPPLERPFPVWVKTGEEFRQEVQVRIQPGIQRTVLRHFQESESSQSSSGRDAEIELPPECGEHPTPGTSRDIAAVPDIPSSVASGGYHRLPRLGLGMASHGLPLNEEEMERLKALRLDHLRCDLTPLTGGCEEAWDEALRQAKELGCGLHVAIHLKGKTDDQTEGKSVEEVTDQLKALAGISRNSRIVDVWMVFVSGEKATSSKWLELARSILGPSRALIVGGTDACFAELNRNRPARGSVDGIAWSINPQVHAYDNLSLVETLGAQWDTVLSARKFFDGDLMISPVTLKPRFDPNATSEPPPVPPDVIPSQVDVRQMSLFGAAWTLGSIASLSRAPMLRSITYYETTGWRGVMEWSDRPRLPHKFVTRPGWVFPVYFVFALLAGYDECRPAPVANNIKRRALLLRKRTQPERVRLLAASFDTETTKLELPGDFAPGRCLTLNHENAVAALREPARFLESGWQERIGGRNLTLPPLSLLAVDGRLH